MSDKDSTGNGRGKPPVVLMPAPAPKKRPKAPVTQLHPASSRRRAELQLETSLLTAMAEHFAKHGMTAIERVYNRCPEAYLRVAAKLVPQRVGDEPLSADDVRALAGLAQALRERAGRAASGLEDNSEERDVH